MYTDDNGIVRFESTDNIAPLQVGLNAAMESVSEAMESVSEAIDNKNMLRAGGNKLGVMESYGVVTNADALTNWGHVDPDDDRFILLGKDYGDEVRVGRLIGTIDQEWLPFKIAVGQVSISLSNSNNGSREFSIPSGIFSSAPNLMGNIVSNTTQYNIAGCHATNSTTGRIYVRRTDGTSQSISLTVGWTAIGT